MASLKALFRRLFDTSLERDSLVSGPVEIAWSNKTYGPDSPWQAVTINIGTPPQVIDLYPGQYWQSTVLSETICNDSSVSSICYARSGFYNPADSSTQSSDVSFLHGTDSKYFSNISLNGTALLPGAGDHIPLVYSNDLMRDLAVFQGQSTTYVVPAFDMYVFSEGYGVLPNGVKCTQEVGSLFLGGTFSLFGQLYHTSALAPSLYASGVVSSSSFGMHIGSAALNIPASLYMGGFDQARVLGPVTAQINPSIELLDIGIGFAQEDSPLSYTSRTGLLAQGNTSISNSLSVTIDPSLPYLYLPQSTCEALSGVLPITYQSGIDLYFWDTANPHYSEIMRSSAFLSFVFQRDGSNEQNVTIQVALALLYMTLTPPITTTPTPYFPCQSHTYGYISGSGGYILGRAFLQAAFLGTNFNASNTWFLAQAPGPNVSSASPESMSVEATQIFGSNETWEDSWKPYWQSSKGNSANDSIPSNGNTATGSSSHSHYGLSAGALATICASGIFCIAFIIAVWYGVRKRKPNPQLPAKKSFSVKN